MPQGDPFSTFLAIRDMHGQSNPLTRRAERAIFIAMDALDGSRPMETLPSGHVLVPAGDGRNYWRVTPGKPGDCTCPDYANGSGGAHACKHVIAVAMVRRAERFGLAARPAPVAAQAAD